MNNEQKKERAGGRPEEGGSFGQAGFSGISHTNEGSSEKMWLLSPTMYKMFEDIGIIKK